MNNIVRKPLLNWMLIGVFLLSIMGIWSQLASAQCPLSMTVTSVPIRQLSVADVDFDHFQSRALLFTLNILNPSPSTVMASLKIRLSIRLADGSLTEPNAMNFLTKGFPVPPGSRTITNLDIGGNAEIKDSTFNLADDVKSNVEDVALSTGKFPAGSYTFAPTLTCSNGGQSGSATITYEIENPSRVELRSPQDGEITSEFPLFEYYSDGSDVVLTVAEKSADQSREDAIAGKPSMQEVELINQNSYLYSGGRPLEAGKTYVWQVVSRTLGSGGTTADVSSPIGLFTVSSSGTAGALTQASGGSATPDMILSQLEQIFGSRYTSIFQQIRAGGFRLTGHYSLNDSTLTQADLLNLINELRPIADSVDVGLE